MGKCYKCGNASGTGKAELRPYGPGGQWVCYTCAFETPEAEAQTAAALKARLDAIDGPVILTPNGPEPLTKDTELAGAGMVMPPGMIGRKN